MPQQSNIVVVKAKLCVCAQRVSMRRYVLSASYVMCNTCDWQSVRTYSLLNHSNRSPAHLSQAGYRHPLAQRDPSQRNIALPDSVHAKSGSADALPAEVLQRRAQKALLLKMQQEVLWEGTVIDNVEHTLIQRFCKLASNPKYRNARNMMIVGGKELIRELCEKGQHPHHLLVTEGKVIPEWARKGQHNMELVLVKENVAEACMSGNDGFIGDFDIPPPPMKEELIANHQRFKRILVLDNVDDAGVLGTLLRTAVGLMYDAVILINHCADLYDHRVIRAACGAHFQQGIPIYSLSDEDGDDVYGMLNHLLSRNKLLPLCFPTQEDMTLPEKNDHTHCNGKNKFSQATMEEEQYNSLTMNELQQHKEGEAQMPIVVSSVVGAQPVLLNTIISLTKPTNLRLHDKETDSKASNSANTKIQEELYLPKQEVISSCEKDKLGIECNNKYSNGSSRSSISNRSDIKAQNINTQSINRPTNLWNYSYSHHRRETLSEFCLQSFSAHRDGPDPGYMLITGPNHKRTMTRRLRERMASPLTQLLLDEINTTDALVGYSVVMHALRPAGDWDYLPVYERTRPSHAKLQEEFASVDIGANRISLDADSINMTEEEQVQAAHERNLFMRWRRQKKRELTDYEHWMSAEERRVKEMLVQQEENLRTPWKASKRSIRSTSRRSHNISDWVPNIIDDYRQPLDRTELKEEQSRSENFVRPPNYDRYTRSTSQETR